MKGTTVIITSIRCRKHEPLLESCGFKIITKFYSNGQPTPLDNCGWRGDKYFIINDRVAKMQRLLDGVDAPFMALVNETRRNAGIKANKNRTNRVKVQVGETLDRHALLLLACSECGRKLEIKVRNRWIKLTDTGHKMVKFIEGGCCRIHYRFVDVMQTDGYLNDYPGIHIRRGVMKYDDMFEQLPEGIRFRVEVMK